ncbi:MAG: hypothetical protein HOO04_06770 [Phycisphaerae bacterium]|nr:hypothetical protein [Phycisphaerae bacterium]
MYITRLSQEDALGRNSNLNAAMLEAAVDAIFSRAGYMPQVGYEVDEGGPDGLPAAAQKIESKPSAKADAVARVIRSSVP